MFWIGGEGPRDVPGAAYLHLVTTLGVPPENLKGLRSLQKVGFRNGKLVTFIRIYDPLQAGEQAPQLKDFASLDQHLELILYEGHWERAGNYIVLERSVV